jgi:hypothetical protein
LKWQIIPSTANTWLNWYICQWDLFVDSVPGVYEVIQENCKNNGTIYFKKTDETSYQIYREITQLIDVIVLDYLSLRYHSRYIVASCIFLTLCMNLEIIYFTKAERNAYTFDEEFYINLLNEAEDSSNRYLVDIYSSFLHQSFNMSFEDILETVVYCSKFIHFEFTYDLPLVMQTNPNGIENVILR